MKLLLAATALSTGLLIAAPAVAQDATADKANDAGIGEIVVTAQKRAENVHDVPIAISAVSGQFLQSRGITSIDNLGSIAPNVKIERAPSNKTAAQISIRGSVTINPAITWEPAVGIYLDGVYVAKAQGSVFDIADLERVEILRGPQGTLYGRNALAGAINLVTRKPSGELHVSAEATYGDYNYMKGRVVLDLPAMGPFSVKLAGQIQKRDGFIKVTPNPIAALAGLASPNSVTSTNDIDSQSFMAQVRMTPAPNLTIDYTFDYNRNNQLPDFAQLVAAPGLAILQPYASQTRLSTASINAVPLLEYSRSSGHALTVALDLGSAEVKSITSYRKLKWVDSLDLDGSPIDIAATTRDTDFQAFSQELQLTGNALSDRLKYAAGVFYYNEKAETLGPQRFFGAFGPGAAAVLQSDYGGHNKAWAAYAQLDYDLTERLKLAVGGRYTHEIKDVRRYFAAGTVGSPITPLFNLPYGGAPDAKFGNFSPALTIAYEASQQVNVYARWARGYKSGGFNGETDVSSLIGSTFSCASAPGQTSELCNPYKPETVNSYEAGIKTRLADGKLVFNFAAFWDEHKEIQLSVFTATGAASSVVKNAAQARIRGLEFEAVARPAPWFTINASFALLDAKYKKYFDGGVDVSSNRAFPHTPKTTANLGVDWDVVQGDWGKFSLLGDLSYVSKYFTFPYALTGNPATTQLAGNSQSQGRTIVNIRAVVSNVKIGSGKLEIAAWVKNFTQENNPQNFIDFGPGFGGLTLGYFPDPRTWGVTVGTKF